MDQSLYLLHQIPTAKFHRTNKEKKKLTSSLLDYALSQKLKLARNDLRIQINWIRRFLVPNPHSQFSFLGAKYFSNAS